MLVSMQVGPALPSLGGEQGRTERGPALLMDVCVCLNLFVWGSHVPKLKSFFVFTQLRQSDVARLFMKHIDLRRLCENCTVAMTGDAGDGPIDRRLIRVQRTGESQFLHH